MSSPAESSTAPSPASSPVTSPWQELLPHRSILACWRRAGATEEAAKALTMVQIAALRKIVISDPHWERLLEIVRRGRAVDSWVARDWPEDFDELLLCAPLCELVKFECQRCTVGRRQQGSSCADPDTVFGRVGVLISNGDRQALVAHLAEVDALLGSDDHWSRKDHRRHKVEPGTG